MALDDNMDNGTNPLWRENPDGPYPRGIPKKLEEYLELHGIAPEKVFVDMGRKEASMLSAYQHFAWYVWTRRGKKFDIITTGKQSIILREGDSIMKFSGDGGREAKLFSRVRKANPRLKNVAYYPKQGMGTLDCSIVHSPFSKQIDCAYFRLNYIPGQTISQNLSESTFSDKDAVKYSQGILNGLLELRRAGIVRHADIRPSNIIINSDNNEPIIVDLGLAMTEDIDNYSDEHSYSDWNDLVGLGQTLYRMVTGLEIRNSMFSTGAGHRIDPKALEKARKLPQCTGLQDLVCDCLTSEYDDCIEISKILSKHYNHLNFR